MADGFAIEIEIRDDVTAALDRAIAAAIDLTPAMKDIAGELADTTRERFETQESPAGVPWKPSRRAEEEGGRTLTLHGHLVDSIREDWGPDHAAAGPEASGPAAVYAAIHQFGGTIRPRPRGFRPGARAKKALSFGGRVVAKVVIPARPYLGFNDENADYAVDTLTAHMAHAFAAGAAEAGA
ncbi:MAG TPA: phage virion morphogenesis protein [Sphingomonas sp.]|nr:phage virion morphogenesis protein [Sphingomonas sp.]